MSLPPKNGEPDREQRTALALLQHLQPALARQDRAELIEIVRKLVSLRAPMGEQWPALAQIAADNGEVALSRAAIELFVAATSGSARARYIEAGFHAHTGAWQDAHALMRSLPDGVLDPAARAHSLGTAALHLGEIAEAREQLELATRLRPGSGPSWLSLAAIVNFAEENELAERLFAGASTASSDERATYYYALGKAHDDRGEHAEAFAAWSRGAKEMKERLDYSRAADRQMALDAVAGYDRTRIDGLAARREEPTSRTIFVAGLPRSGTTLVEQILTSHSEICDGGEIDLLRLLVKDIRGLTWPELEAYVSANGTGAAARLWNHWIAERFPATGRVVDKTLNTSRFLGLTAALLPEAPLIWITRDPVDCALSCFRTFFTSGQPWSCDLEDIAFHFRLEDALRSRWIDILGDRLLVVPYHELVSEPDNWIRTILAHCGLDAEPAVFSPHENKRTVTTSSVMQVRQPINRKGLGSAAPYRQYLEPFLHAYRG